MNPSGVERVALAARHPRVRGLGGLSLRWWMLATGIALAGNATWEMAQMPLYASSHPLLGCLRAAVVDAALTLAAVMVARRAGARDSRAFWSTLVGLLVIAAAVIEAASLASGQWAYSSAMPTLDDVGLVPLIQLPLLACLAVLLADRLDRLRGNRGGLSRPRRHDAERRG